VHRAEKSNAYRAYLSEGLSKREKKSTGKTLFWTDTLSRTLSSTARRKYRIIEILVRGIMHEGARGHAINVHLRRDPRKDTAFLMHTSGLPRGYY